MSVTIREVGPRDGLPDVLAPAVRSGTLDALTATSDRADVAAALTAGTPVLLTGPDAGVALLAAQTATPCGVAWAVRHGTGLLRAVLSPEGADLLRLPAMYGTDRDHSGLVQTVTVDAASGVTTGISAADRARTLRVLGHPSCGPADLVAPGHMIVELLDTFRAEDVTALVAKVGTRLCQRAGLTPVAAVCDLVDDDGEVAEREYLSALAQREGLPIVPLSV